MQSNLVVKKRPEGPIKHHGRFYFATAARTTAMCFTTLVFLVTAITTPLESTVHLIGLLTVVLVLVLLDDGGEDELDVTQAVHLRQLGFAEALGGLTVIPVPVKVGVADFEPIALGGLYHLFQRVVLGDDVVFVLLEALLVPHPIDGHDGGLLVHVHEGLARHLSHHLDYSKRPC